MMKLEVASVGETNPSRLVTTTERESRRVLCGARCSGYQIYDADGPEDVGDVEDVSNLHVIACASSSCVLPSTFRTSMCSKL